MKRWCACIFEGFLTSYLPNVPAASVSLAAAAAIANFSSLLSVRVTVLLLCESGFSPTGQTKTVCHRTADFISQQ